MKESLTESAVKRLVLAAAPERESEFENLWSEFTPQIEFIQDKEGFSLEAGAFDIIIFNHKSMSHLWILGFAAQYALHAYSPYLVLSQILKLSITSKSFTDHDETIQIINKAKGLIGKTLELNQHYSIDDFQWPEGVPEPSDGKPSDVDGSMVFDLLCMGGAYCFLHEIRHLMLKSNSSVTPHDEEMECDLFAREFLLAEIDNYSKASGFPIDAVKTKRAMSIGVTALLLLVLTPKRKWGGSLSHPSIVNRISELTNYLNLTDDNYFWTYLSCILLLILDYQEITFSHPAISSQKQFCLFLLEKIDESINQVAAHRR